MAGQGDAILALDLFRLLRAVDPLSRVGIDVVWLQFLLVTVIRRRDLALPIYHRTDELTLEQKQKLEKSQHRPNRLGVREMCRDVDRCAIS
jgi:hypothetical protein